MEDDIKSKKINKKTILLLTATLVVLGIVGVVIYWFFSSQRTKETVTTPKAVNYDISGRWKLTAHITSPSAQEQEQLAVFSQSSTGRITGMVTNMDGSNPQNFTGQVTGNHFVSDPVTFSGKFGIISYSGTLTFDGTIAEGANSMAGDITGNITTPVNEPLVGTFNAVRTEAAPATATPTPQITSTPLSTNTPTPVLTGSPVAISGTNTPMPIPVTGTGQSLSIVIAALILVGSSLLLVF